MINEKIIEQYISILNLNTSNDPNKDDKYLNNDHLIWMLLQIRDNNEQSLTKKHRWLGFVQGIMIMKRYTTVDEEKLYKKSF